MDNRTQHSSPDNDSQTFPQIVLSRQRSGRKKICKDRAKVFNSTHMLINKKQYRTRLNKMNELVKQDIRDFFEDDGVSMVCPGKKDCITKFKIKKQKGVLTNTLKNHHVKFLGKVNYKVGYVSFCKLKPFWVVKYKVSERDICFCKVYANIEFLVSALFKKNIIDNANIKEFTCHVCCHIDNVACLQRMCGNYKITVSAMDAVTFNDAFIKFLYHEGNVIHQFRAIKMLKTKLNPNEAFHFEGSRKQYTLHTSQIYFKKDEPWSCCCLGTSSHLQPIFEFLKLTVPQITIVHFLRDNPTTQYRNKTILYLIAHALQHSIEVSLSGLGKGAPDGVGSCLKRTADRVIAQGEDIDCFESYFFKVLNENVRKIQIILVYEHDIQSMKDILPSEILSFKGTFKNKDKSITVNRLKKLGNSFTEFIVTDNDNCVISTDQVLQVLPNPNLLLKKRKVVNLFPFKVNVKEL
ncbi:hypothetical protein QTP88_016531 [Uroleucon formosanum]